MGEAVDKKGIIFEISQYMVEDGPGIRTVIFFKGCPLRCKWCSNPYGLKRGKQLSVNVVKCTGCGHCIESCQNGAISLKGRTVVTDFNVCATCGKCIPHCPISVRREVGREIMASEVVTEAEAPRMFYRRGGGGITLSGGEILMQAGFAEEILKICKSRMLDTAIETSAFGKWEDLHRLILLCDTVFIDIKCLDSAKHEEITGVNNEIILENSVKAADLCVENKIPLIFRLPLVPTLNDYEENIINTADFVKSLPGNLELNVLPFHDLGKQKYEFVGIEYTIDQIEPAKASALQRIHKLLDSTGVRYSIGGSNVKSY